MAIRRTWRRYEAVLTARLNEYRQLASVYAMAAALVDAWLFFVRHWYPGLADTDSEEVLGLVHTLTAFHLPCTAALIRTVSRYVESSHCPRKVRVNRYVQSHANNSKLRNDDVRLCCALVSGLWSSLHVVPASVSAAQSMFRLQ